MAVIRSTFDRVGDLYSRWFADWLHVHFLIRTVLILFVLFLIIYLSAQLIQYVIAPVILMLFYHVIFRAWNFLFIETPQEWIYIRYHSKDKTNFSELYLRLCDKIKYNRIVRSHTKYKGMVLRSRKFAFRLIIICAVTATLWVSAFGLHHEYSAPAVTVISENNGEETDIPEEIDILPEALPNEPAGIENHLPTVQSTFHLQENSVLTLNELGSAGTRLYDGPGISGQTILEILWDDAEFIYQNENVPDEYVNGLFWLYVQSADGTMGYISSQLVEYEGE
jgi:hypothetical protein